MVNQQQIKTTRTGTTPAQFPQPGHQPHPQPKPVSNPRELSVEEKAALWDEVTALHRQTQETQNEIDRLRFKQLTLKGKRDALFSQGGYGLDSKNGGLGPCQFCGYENCICERIS